MNIQRLEGGRGGTQPEMILDVTNNIPSKCEQHRLFPISHDRFQESPETDRKSFVMAGQGIPKKILGDLVIFDDSLWPIVAKCVFSTFGISSGSLEKDYCSLPAF